jgi:outer membrane protein assembly factor BamB
MRFLTPSDILTPLTHLRRSACAKIAAGTLLFPLCGICAAAPGDWPQFRGPNRDGVSAETGLLQQWPQGGPRLAWRATGLGGGYSSLSIVANHIFTIGEKGDSSFVLVLNAADGQPDWNARLGKSGAPGWGSFEGPRATPTLDGDLLYALGQWGDLVCLESATGKEVWRKSFTNDFGATRPEWGFSESPLVDGDNVVFTPGGPKGAVVALNKKTGELVWQSKDFTDPAQYSSLIVAEIGGARQYIQLTMANVAGVAAGDGKVLWRAPRKGQVAVISTPICQDDLVYVSSGYGIGCNLFKITASGGTFQAKQVYANKVMVNHHGGVVKVGDFLYGYSEGKGWTCQDLKTGASKWEEKEKLGKGSLVYADGRLYLRQEDKQGTVALIEASDKGYKERGRFDQPDRSNKKSWTHPVVAGGKLYLRDQDLLLCYDVKGK